MLGVSGSGWMARQGLGSPQEPPELWGQGAGQGGTAALGHMEPLGVFNLSPSASIPPLRPPLACP